MTKTELKQLRDALPRGAYDMITKRMKDCGKEIGYSSVVQVLRGTWVNIDVLNHAIDIANEHAERIMATNNRAKKMNATKSKIR